MRVAETLTMLTRFVKDEIGNLKTDVQDKETVDDRDSESDIEHHVRVFDSRTGCLGQD